MGKAKRLRRERVAAGLEKPHRNAYWRHRTTIEDIRAVIPGAPHMDLARLEPYRLRFVPDPILRQECRPARGSDRVTELVMAMGRVCIEEYGRGLAAPQVGALLCVVLLWLRDKDRFDVLINPHVVSVGKGINVTEEGCLSLPGRQFKVQRPDSISVRALDLEGEDRTYEYHGLEAAACCHELDHLRGLLIDRAGLF